MQRNLDMIEKHRQKMGFLVGAIIFLFLYLCFATFWLTTITFLQKIDTQNLETKNTRIVSILTSRETYLEHPSPDASKIIQGILEDSSIITSLGQQISDFQASENVRDIIPLNTNIYFGPYLYKHTLFQDGNTNFDILSRIEVHDYTKLNLSILGILVFAGPFIFSLLAFIGCRVMHKVYRPIKDIVMNLEDFSANVNHEFKTSLSEIISTLELAKITQDYEEAVDQSLNSSKRLNTLLDSLGIFIRFVNSEYRRKNINIISFLDATIGDHSKKIEEKNIGIIKRYNPKSVVKKFIDEEPLNLCFNNILKNAIRYSNNSGKIEIDIQKKFFSIKDYGVGIEEKNIDKIFDRYFRENYSREGSGIGLSLVKKICDKYNWKIELKSEKDVYTYFAIHF